MKYQRDAFIDVIYDRACKDKEIFFLSADFGAPALDKFRQNLPENFIHLGIAEQNMIDVAIGLSIAGKKVFTYAMAPFISLRCAEQHKLAAMMQLPIVNIVAGVGLGYANAGPTHYATEDLGLFFGYPNAEVYTASDSFSAGLIAESLIDKPHFAFVRLDRDKCEDLEGFSPLDFEAGYRIFGSGKKACVISHGYLLAHLKAKLNSNLIEQVTLVDAFRCKGNIDKFTELFSNFSCFLFIDEQINGSDLGTYMLEKVPPLTPIASVRKMSLKSKYYFLNTGRDALLSEGGLSIESIEESLADLLMNA